MAQTGQMPDSFFQEKMQSFSKQIKRTLFLSDFFSKQQQLSIYLSDVKKLSLNLFQVIEILFICIKMKFQEFLWLFLDKIKKK